jgi:hypothetical protein
MNLATPPSLQPGTQLCEIERLAQPDDIGWNARLRVQRRRREAGHQEDGEQWEAIAHCRTQRGTAHARHAEIGQHRVDAPLRALQRLQRLDTVGRFDDGGAIEPQPLGDGLPDAALVRRQYAAR